jgi:hypothetical protein
VIGVRRAVELLVNRIFRSRYGLAALLVVVVVSILGSAKLVAGPGREPPPVGAPARPLVTVDPTTGDDGLTSPEPPPEPATGPRTAKPLAVARAFASAWLRHQDVSAEEWHAGLLPHSTEDLTERLAGVDPAGVPADRITGELAIIPRGADFVDVTVPVDSGRLLLRLIAPEGRWLVDGVDWERT